MANLAALGHAELKRRWREAQQLIRDHGVTYHVHGDPKGESRPWRLDPLPLVLGPQEAAQLEAGLIQRARLLEMLCTDIYGPQRVLADGLLPPELILGNPGFLRPCHGVNPVGGRYLHFYAVNLGRDQRGQFHVLSDRTQAPSGAGYALENRIVLGRTLPEAFRECRVQRLALFFRGLQQTLRAIAPRNQDNPRIVLLSPGPNDATYFEHAYLARYLGYTLAEGGDLTVRDHRVFLKVLGGLQPVDVLFRRLKDSTCDPLELSGSTTQGIPGLIQAVRHGHIAVANALGTGVVETPALLPYLPGLCRALLSEELRLPAVPTWWCGTREGLGEVMARWPRVVLKAAYAASAGATYFPSELPSAEQSQLQERLQASPHAFVGQECLALATAPTWHEGRVEPRRCVLRLFVAADGQTFTVMPGGLTRVGATADAIAVSLQHGGGSKDTWVLSDGPVSNFTLLPTSGQEIVLSRAGGDLPSRAADNLYWLGRYTERAEGSSRILRAILNRLADQSLPADAPEIAALLRAWATQTGRAPVVAVPPTAIRELLIDPQRSDGLPATLRAVRQVAELVRDRLSHDMWHVLNNLGDCLGTAQATTGELLDGLNRIILGLVGFGGLATESMTRGEGWRFLDLGRKLERALHTIALLRGTLLQPESNESPTLDAVLEIADCGMTYRRRYRSSLRPAGVLDLLVADETNPRSLVSQLAALTENVEHLPRANTVPGRGPELRLAYTAVHAVRMAEIERLVEISAGTRAQLQALLDHLQQTLPALSDLLTLRYLSHLQATRQLAPAEGGA